MMLDLALAFYLRCDFKAFLKYVLPIIEPTIAFEDSWYIDYVVDVLNSVTTSELTRVIINMPPRTLKSLMMVAYVAWRMGNNPALKVIMASATREVSRRHAVNFARLVRSAQFRMIFPEFALESDRVFEQRTTMNGYRLSVSMGQGITGQGADLIIVDDPNSAHQMVSEAHRKKIIADFSGTLYTRLTNKARGQIILVQQRLHEEDLSGHLMARSQAWKPVVVPAIAAEDTVIVSPSGKTFQRAAGDILLPKFNTPEVMAEIRDQAGPLQFEAQYQQNPTPARGNIISNDDIVLEDEMPTIVERKVVSWDTASTLGENADYSVGTVWGVLDRHFYLLDVVRGRYSPVDLHHLIVDTHLTHDANETIIEDTELGRAMNAYLVRDSDIRPRLRRSRFDKVARLEAQAYKFQSRHVHFPRDATWLGPLMSELMGFPNVTHDDQVDSISQALDYLTQRAQRMPKITNRYVPERQVKRPRGKVGMRRKEGA